MTKEQAQAEYIKFLEKDIADNAMFLYAHGIQASQKTVDEGERLRSAIETASPLDPENAEKGIGGDNWVSVNTELPPNFTTCLVWIEALNEVALGIILNELWRDEQDQAIYPTYWMNLPQPPKE